MKTFRTIIQFIGMCFVIFVSGYAGWIIRDVFPPGRAGISSAPSARPATITEQIESIQIQVGCEKVDAYTSDAPIGPEFKRLVNAAIMAERPELFNQYASKWDYMYKEKGK